MAGKAHWHDFYYLMITWPFTAMFHCLMSVGMTISGTIKVAWNALVFLPLCITLQNADVHCLAISLFRWSCSSKSSPALPHRCITGSTTAIHMEPQIQMHTQQLAGANIRQDSGISSADLWHWTVKHRHGAMLQPRQLMTMMKMIMIMIMMMMMPLVHPYM